MIVSADSSVSLRDIFFALTLLLATPLLTGCLASQVVGDIARSDDKSIELTPAPGVDLSRLGSAEGIGVKLRPVTQSGQYVASMGQGTTNVAVYSDMLVQELLKHGLNAGAIAQGDDQSDEDDFEELRSRGFDVLLRGNLNLSMTTSTFAMATGGDYMNTGVSGFTLRALNLDGDLLFIVSAEYGKSRSAGEVAGDIGQLLEDAMAGRQGTTSETSGTDSSGL